MFVIIPAVHLVLWIMLPSLLEGSLRLDAAEGMTGGPEWQLSYPKHPPFSEWLTAIAWYAGPARYVALYTLSQCLAVGSVVLMARWLMKEVGVGPAFIALLAGLASPFTTYIPVQLNHNIGVMPFWALVLITAWAAFNSDRIRVWVAFGFAVGLGLWTKYSVLHLVGPLGLLCLLVPEWRKRIAGPGPWIAALIAMVLIAPHAMDVVLKGSQTVQHAMRPTHMSPREVAGFAFNMTVNGLLLVVFASLLFIVSAGVRPFFKAVADTLHPDRATPKDLFLTVAAFGPIVLVAMSPALGIRPRPLWITPMIVPVIAWLAQVVSRVESPKLHRGFWLASTFAFLLAAGYMSAILVPIQNERPQYSTLDHRKIARDARDYWAANGQGQLAYIVPAGMQRPLHAAGSIAFDLPHRVHVFDNANLALSPWIDPDDLKRHGALVIGSPDIPDEFTVLGLPVVRRMSYPTPTLRGRPRRALAYGVVEPVVR